MKNFILSIALVLFFANANAGGFSMAKPADTTTAQPDTKLADEPNKDCPCKNKKKHTHTAVANTKTPTDNGHCRVLDCSLVNIASGLDAPCQVSEKVFNCSNSHDNTVYANLISAQVTQRTTSTFQSSLALAGALRDNLRLATDTLRKGAWDVAKRDGCGTDLVWTPLAYDLECEVFVYGDSIIMFAGNSNFLRRSVAPTTTATAAPITAAPGTTGASGTTGFSSKGLIGGVTDMAGHAMWGKPAEELSGFEAGSALLVMALVIFGIFSFFAYLVRQGMNFSAGRRLTPARA
jgi:hypothetical protein